MNANEAKVGDNVLVTFPWSADELPTDKNFHEGAITEVISKSEFICYVKVEGLESLQPIDRVKKFAHTGKSTVAAAAA